MTMKKIAVINDLSGFGRCSLVAAISVLSALGVSAHPLPTAILSAQTGYEHYFCDDYTDRMDGIAREWARMQVSFDGIYTGFLANTEQVDKILAFVDRFYQPQTFLLVDPVMGDDGQTYDMFSAAMLREIRKLSARADILTPNLTELCLLTDTDYRALQSPAAESQRLERITRAGQSLCDRADQHVIVTGVHFCNEQGEKMVANLHITQTAMTLSAAPYIGRSYSGTGDLFASCLAGGIAQGRPLDTMIRRAGEFIHAALVDSAKNQVPEVAGVNFEPYLHLLR